MKRSGVSVDDVASLDNLSAAFWRAARGKRHRADVQAMAAELDRALGTLGDQLRAGTVPVGDLVRFTIRDPKPRIIHAPSFRERVLHHALFAVIGPVLDRALIADTYACRVGRGSAAAVARARHHARRFPWFVKLDMRRYFDSIDHAVLLGELRRRLKEPRLLHLLERIVGAYAVQPGKGLPIGALSSQYFANLYLGRLDRGLSERSDVGGYVRYMDDAVAWCRSRDDARAVFAEARRLASSLALELHPKSHLQRTRLGLAFLGYRVLPDRLLPSRRRRHRYRRARAEAEQGFETGALDARALQGRYAAAVGILADADCAAWRARDLARHPPPEV